MMSTSSVHQDNVHIIFNPAGGSVIDASLEELCSTFAQQHVRYHIYETAQDEDLAPIVAGALAAKASTVVAAGGDGTVSGVANALVGSAVPLGIVPLGTGNVLAHELSIPIALEEACGLIIRAPRQIAIDAMQVGNRHFFSHISLGLYAAIAAETTVTAKRRMGRLAYVAHAVRGMLRPRLWNFTIVNDGVEQRAWASTILIANARAVGIGSLQWSDTISMTDGVIDACIVRARSFGSYAQVIGQIVRKQFGNNGVMQIYHARETLTITTAQRIPVRGDGEIIGYSTVAIKVVPQAVRVIVP